MIETDYFQGRLRNHEDACNMFVGKLATYGATCVPVGLECNMFGASKTLINYDNEVSRFLRHFPDIYVIFSHGNSILVDVKSETGRYPNYSIEADSVHAAIELSHINKPTYFACIDISTAAVQLIDSTKLDNKTIYVPRPDRIDDIKQKFPRAKVFQKNIVSGSGTPFMLVPKSNMEFETLDNFVKNIIDKDDDECSWQAVYAANRVLIPGDPEP